MSAARPINADPENMIIADSLVGNRLFHICSVLSRKCTRMAYDFTTIVGASVLQALSDVGRAKTAAADGRAPMPLAARPQNR